MAWLRFFCSTSSLLVLMQMPIMPACGAARGRGRWGGVGRGIMMEHEAQRVAEPSVWNVCGDASEALVRMAA
jgi:hypothetical protein